MNAEDYLGLVTSQHRGAPRFLAWVRFLVSLFDPNVHETLIEAFSISGAQGAQLDALGALCGVSRNVLGEGKPLDDDLYRRLLRAKIVRNQFSGRQGELTSIWETVFGDELGLTVHDNQDMTMSVDLSAASYSPDMLLLLLRGFIVPKPLGVSMRYSLTTDFVPLPLGSACVFTAGGVCAIPSGDVHNHFYALSGSGALVGAFGSAAIPSADHT